MYNLFWKHFIEKKSQLKLNRVISHAMQNRKKKSLFFKELKFLQTKFCYFLLVWLFMLFYFVLQKSLFFPYQYLKISYQKFYLVNGVSGPFSWPSFLMFTSALACIRILATSGQLPITASKSGLVPVKIINTFNS